MKFEKYGLKKKMFMFGKDESGKLYKSSTQNISFFNIDETFLINKREKLDEIYYYLLTKENSNKLIKNRFLRQEIYSLWQSFV